MLIGLHLSIVRKLRLNLNENNQFTLLQNTYLRLKGLNDLKNPIIISNEEQRFIASEQMRQINVTPLSIVLEPVGKNTAPAILWGVLQIPENQRQAPVVVLASDHGIKAPEEFVSALKSA